KVRTLIIRDYQRAFESFDAVISPTSPTTAFKIGERTGDPLAMYLSDVFTIPANLAGVPAISIPCGLDETGLPVGLQVAAPALGESMVLRVARALEREIAFAEVPAVLRELAA
ncbi:MAG: amidase family protein, partial [Actinomycetota bacterium]